MAEPEKLCALHDQMVRRWGRCVCATPVNTAWPAAHPPPDIIEAQALCDGKPIVSAPRKSRHIVTVAQRYAYELGEASRIRRAAIKRGAPTDPSHRILRTAVYLRDAGRCQMCGRPLNPDVIGVTADDDPDRMTMDHIIPVSKGGRHTYENVRASCKPCNLEKADQLDE